MQNTDEGDSYGVVEFSKNLTGNRIRLVRRFLDLRPAVIGLTTQQS